MDAQVEQAIELAFNPHTDQQLRAQAYEFLNQLKQDPNAWQYCLPLFIRTPSPSEVVRVVCLEMVNNAVQTQRLDQQTLVYVRDSLMSYLRQWYAPGSTNIDSPTIQNKLTQTVTYLFASLYATEWTSFFDDFRELAEANGGTPVSNPVATIMYLRVVGSVHDEIADQMIPRTPDELRRHNELKDLIRARDVTKIGVTWREVLSRWQQTDMAIAEMCLRTIAKWVSWIDINLVLDNTVQQALLELAGQQGIFESESKQASARDAAIDVFTETVGKKMAANDKIELIRYLNLESIVAQLLQSPALSTMRNTANYDTDLAETVAKLVNNVMFDVVKIIDTESQIDGVRARAERLLEGFMPHLLRLFSDEYDEICSAVIPSMTDLLTMLRKKVKAGSDKALYSAMLRPILEAIIAKMKYDETATWGEDADTADEAEFQELRKRLHVLQQTVAAVDEELYMSILTDVVASAFNRLGQDDKLDWRDLDLAMHEMYLFGELATRNGGLWAKRDPSDLATQRLMEMMVKMVDANLAVYPHPAIQLQYMEICVRYVQFFEHHPEGLPRVLEAFVRFIRSNHHRVRLRSWYLFLRFVRHLRSQLASFRLEMTVVDAVRSLLPIKAQLLEDKDDDDISSDDDGQSANAEFTSQLFLYEAVGVAVNPTAVPMDTKIATIKSVIDPLTEDLMKHLPAAASGDARAIMQVHHIIMAFGAVAYGYSNWTPGAKTGSPPDEAISAEFAKANEATLTALEALIHTYDVRNAARTAFSRYIGVLGAGILSYLLRWIRGLLSSASSNDEMAMFLRTLNQVVFGFKDKIKNDLDALMSELLQRTFAGLSQPTTGTDDEVQMRELKQQHLNFILVILNNDLASVLVSPSNQASFDPFIATLTRFSCDASDPQSARLAFSSLCKVTSIWGGPDIDIGSPTAPQPTIPGFDGFILSSFAPLPWDLIRAGGFNPQDAQMRSVLQEAAELQWIILRKVGVAYADQLSIQLRELGMNEELVKTYMGNISKSSAEFKKWFVKFIQDAKR